MFVVLVLIIAGYKEPATKTGTGYHASHNFTAAAYIPTDSDPINSFSII